VPENPTSGSRFYFKGPKTEGSEGKADVLMVKAIRRLSLFRGLRSRAPESVEVKRAAGGTKGAIVLPLRGNGTMGTGEDIPDKG
jgi:hypothetical protein